MSLKQDMHLLGAMGPPGGGRMVISRRLQSRFNMINMCFPQVYLYLKTYKSCRELCSICVHILHYIDKLNIISMMSNIFKV